VAMETFSELMQSGYFTFTLGLVLFGLFALLHKIAKELARTVIAWRSIYRLRQFYREKSVEFPLQRFRKAYRVTSLSKWRGDGDGVMTSLSAYVELNRIKQFLDAGRLAESEELALLKRKMNKVFENGLILPNP